jgi:hypothetical protein
MTEPSASTTGASPEKGMPLQLIYCRQKEDIFPYEQVVEAFGKSLQAESCTIIPAGQTINKNDIYEHYVSVRDSKVKKTFAGMPVVYYRKYLLGYLAGSTGRLAMVVGN